MMHGPINIRLEVYFDCNFTYIWNFRDYTELHKIATVWNIEFMFYILYFDKVCYKLFCVDVVL